MTNAKQNDATLKARIEQELDRQGLAGEYRKHPAQLARATIRATDYLLRLRQIEALELIAKNLGPEIVGVLSR